MIETEGGFRGEFWFLSNFADFDTPIVYDGMLFRTNEHFYQAMKFKAREHRVAVSSHPKKGLKRFVYSKSEHLRSDWDEIKLKVMEYGLRYKFSEKNPALREMLLDTGHIKLVEYNSWGDKFWGVSIEDCEGENHLGRLIMKIRDEIAT